MFVSLHRSNSIAPASVPLLDLAQSPSGSIAVARRASTLRPRDAPGGFDNETGHLGASNHADAIAQRRMAENCRIAAELRRDAIATASCEQLLGRAIGVAGQEYHTLVGTARAIDERGRRRRRQEKLAASGFEIEALD